MSDYLRIAQLDDDGNDVAYVTMAKSVHDGLSEDELSRVRVLDEENDPSGESTDPLDRYRRPRAATYPPTPQVAGEAVPPPGYDAKTKADLEAEIATRNEGRPDDAQVSIAPPGNKAELVAALEADDKARTS